ncbi:DUF6042 family protein [Kibdelosporangium aridum]|uniref:Uncharacterized protein n=1 Tax=Kibdelosporangium aridum TaxID=2030 RepID=A0A1W2F9R9_KIBAR|nr:DUF6042 family protein [Kibdelosporangium aridum]SMD18670.1 hypothetical protein SAMN05661093_05858 [Kibdelosporangium aridum]
MALLGTYHEDEYLPEYGLIVLRDTPVEGSWPEWPESVLNEGASAAARCGTFAGGGNAWFEASAGDGYHVITMESHDSEPPEDGEWDDVAETLYRSWSGIVGLTILTGAQMRPDLRLGGRGLYRVRVARQKGEDFGDTWRLQFWPQPEPVAPPRWLKRGTPPVPSPDPGWDTVIGSHAWELPYIVSQAGDQDGATIDDVAAWAVAHHRPADWLDERLFPVPAPALPTGHADLDEQATQSRSSRIAEAAAEEAKLASYAAQLGVPAPTTRRGLLTFFVAAGLVTYDGRKYRRVSSPPLAREVLRLPADLVTQLAMQSDRRQYQSFATDIASVAAWLDGRAVTVGWLADQLLATQEEVRATLHYAQTQAMLEVTGDTELRMDVLRGGRLPAGGSTPPPAQVKSPPKPAPVQVSEAGAPPRAGVLAAGHIVGDETVELPPLESRISRALQSAYGILLITYGDPITLVQPGGESVSFGTDLMPHVVLSPDGRRLATVEARLGRDSSYALQLYDLADLSHQTMPWDDTLSIGVIGIYRDTVYFSGEYKPMSWTPGSDPVQLDRQVREIDPISGRTLAADSTGLIITDQDGTTHQVPLDQQCQLVPGGAGVYRVRNFPNAITVFPLEDIQNPQTHWLPDDSILSPSMALGPVWESPTTLLVPSKTGAPVHRLDLTTGALERVPTPPRLQALVEPLLAAG